jgi:hypothetical protein
MSSSCLMKYALVSKVFYVVGSWYLYVCTEVRVHVEYKAYAVSD